MSFIRDHLHSFVYPNLLKLYYGWDGLDDPNNPKPMSKEDEMVAKLLLNDKDKLEKAGYYTVNRYNRFFLQSKVQQHNKTRLYKYKAFNLIHDTLNAIEYKIKPWQKLILPGRDCWLFYVAGMKRKAFKNRMVFLPQISRNVCTYAELGDKHPVWQLLKENQVNQEDFFFDTGFFGTILAWLRDLFNTILNKYKGGKGWKWDLALGSSYLLSTANQQIYPCILKNNIYRDAVLAIEEAWKYWYSARQKGNNWGCWCLGCRSKTKDYLIDQTVKREKEEVLCAAKLTLEIWNH